MDKKVALAVSGGIDSAISAYKLQEMGFDVIGVNFKFWKWKKENFELTKINEDLLNDISKKIKFEIKVINYENLFKDSIVNDYIYKLSIGQTPNPCVRCNPLVKFRLLIDFANEENIEFISTGHYAQVEKDCDGKYHLEKGIDHSKDQSYVLCYLTQELLSRTIFPLGNTFKTDNILLAKRLGLKSALVGESQDLCFVSPKHFQQFIKESMPAQFLPGDIVDVNGNKLGTHAGLPMYTIGQRKGINVSAEKPFYVMNKDSKLNHLIVGHLDELGNNQFIVDNINWINPTDFNTTSCDVKIRYRAQQVRCKIENCKENLHLVTITKKMRDITPGQYAVFYKNDEVIGGGVIKGCQRKNE